MSADATAVDIEALTTSSIDLWVLLGEEEAWLDDNPPASCYAELHAAYSRAVSTLYEALDLISDAIGRRRTAARGK